MKIVSGGQTGVDRAALDVAIERGMDWGGWCPKGGWAEDLTEPPGVLARYPKLKETPLANPVQRTEWNVRDADATLVLVDKNGIKVSIGAERAVTWARKHGKPILVVGLTTARARERAQSWLAAQRRRFGPDITVGIGGPREGESPGIYARSYAFLMGLLDRLER